MGNSQESDKYLKSRILAHRGMWKEPEERNTIAALALALKSGYGIETDVRDHDGELVIEHDLPGVESKRFVELVETIETESLSDPLLAFNVKSDGLSALLVEFQEILNKKTWFLFDMSYPESRQLTKHRLPTAQRVSEYEKATDLETNCEFLWIDNFETEWFIHEDHLWETPCTKIIVSPELHGRDRSVAWQWFLDLIRSGNTSTYMCTDFPDELFELLKP